MISKYGDWTRAGIVLKGLSMNLHPACVAKMQENGQMVLDRLVGHIDAQDLPWVPLSERTIQFKNGDETIYVETGFLRNNLRVRKIKSNQRDYNIFIGANPWVKHENGEKLSDLMIWLEYGTESMPARPLIRPTWEEVEPLIKSSMSALIRDLTMTGGATR